MSAPGEGAAGGGPKPGPRRRTRASIVNADAVRGAPAEMLDRPASEVLEAIPWQGPSPDPNVLDAATFLAWL